jgi:hypothetical protein
MVLNLSSFSSLSGSSALIRPILLTNKFLYVYTRVSALDVFPVSELSDASCCFWLLVFCHRFPSAFKSLIHVV